jgi:hypothetical protein
MQSHIEDWFHLPIVGRDVDHGVRFFTYALDSDGNDVI